MIRKYINDLQERGKYTLMNGMDLFTLSKILGHSSVEVTEQAYLDLTDDDICQQQCVFQSLSNPNP